MSAARSVPPGFVLAGDMLAHNLRRGPELAGMINARAERWARRVHPLGYLPHLMEAVLVRGYERLPRVSEDAPIFAFSHKKLHDVFAVVELLGGRPLERFFDLTIVAQAGLFSGIYPYRDLVPQFLKTRATRSIAAALANRVGLLLRDIFESVNAYPVYREGSDVPTSRAEYDGPDFAGRLLTGLDYEEFKRMAARKTRETLTGVQRDLVERNRMLIIAPEGGYRSDGSIRPLHNFLGMVALRKARPTITASLSYDELCPDRWGRICGWVEISEALAPPQKRSGLASWTAGVRARLQENTIALASHLIATAVLAPGRQDFSERELVEQLSELTMRLSELGAPFDPGLMEQSYLEERLERFMRANRKRYLRKKAGRYAVDPEGLKRFYRSERTVDNLHWNRNHIKHLDTV